MPLTAQETNNVSLINVIEQLNIAQQPEENCKLVFPGVLVSFWVRADPSIPTKGNMRLSLRLPDGNIERVREGTIQLDLTEHNRLRSFIGQFSISIPQEGRYTFVVELQMNAEEEWKTMAEIPLDIIYQPQENPDETDN
jgi:hypothetical protein